MCLNCGSKAEREQRSKDYAKYNTLTGLKIKAKREILSETHLLR